MNSLIARTVKQSLAKPYASASIVHRRFSSAPPSDNDDEPKPSKKPLIYGVILVGAGLYFYSKYQNSKPSKYDDKYVQLPGLGESAKTQFFRYRDESYISPVHQKGKYVGALSDPSHLSEAPPTTKGK